MARFQISISGAFSFGDKRELRIITEESQVSELNQFGLFLRTWIKLSPGIESTHENITLVSKHNE
jgi:hypothetical protein